MSADGDGRWKMEDGKWKMERGKMGWRTQVGKVWGVEKVRRKRYCPSSQRRKKEPQDQRWKFAVCERDDDDNDDEEEEARRWQQSSSTKKSAPSTQSYYIYIYQHTINHVTSPSPS